MYHESEKITGSLVTPDGERLRAVATLKELDDSECYTHMGSVRIPASHLDTFAQVRFGYRFEPDTGERFDEMRSVETDGGEAQVTGGEIILLREKP